MQLDDGLHGDGQRVASYADGLDEALGGVNFPFDIEISFGAVEFNADKYDLNELIKEADKEQYKEKRKHHAKKR